MLDDFKRGIVIKMWTHYGDQFLGGELGNASRFLRFSPGENSVLLAMRTWLILYNPPNFTDLVCKLYSDRNGLPGALIATSVNSWKRDIPIDEDPDSPPVLNRGILSTHDYGAKEIFFDFNPKISLNSQLYYHFVLNCSGYSFTEDSHLAWRKAWPDPIYGNATFNGLLYSTYMFALVGAPL